MIAEHGFLWDRVTKLNHLASIAEIKFQRIGRHVVIGRDRNEIIAPGLAAEIYDPVQDCRFAATTLVH